MDVANRKPTTTVARARRPGVSKPVSVKPLVRFIKGGDGDVDDRDLAYGSMAAERSDKHCRHRPERKRLPVYFHPAFSGEDEINLGHLFVIMRSRVRLNVDLMERGNAIAFG